MADSIPYVDPYDPKPTLWQRHPNLAWVIGVFVATVVLTYVSFPPVNTGEAAYVLALPGVLWAFRRPGFKVFAWTMFAAQAVAWTALLWWLHNVTWPGLFLLGPFVGAIVGVWFLAAWWAIPRMFGHKALVRVLVVFGLAAAWVLLEWFRGVLFGGFPWLPLSVSQWQRPFILQVAAYGGGWAVSFALICFNIGAAAYAHRAFFERVTGLRKRSPEFNIALLVLMSASFPFLGELFNQQRQPLVRATLVQPYIPQNEKWDSASANAVLATIEKVTLDASRRGAGDVIIWPEAVTPWALYRDPAVADWLGSVSKRAKKPLLLGSVYTEGVGDADQRWFNGAFIVDPETGVSGDNYAKRKLVPFGEYIPLRPIFGWLEKFVPIGGDFQRGTESTSLMLPASNDNRVPTGVLICYEDIFPNLARDSVQSGAELLAVLTNNGWFGEGGAAYQHAAHSVLRAVENRRPLVRVGNGGWSGWIDEYGYIRKTLKDENGSVYFRGSETIAITRDARWRHRLSFYTEHGDWFLLVCAALMTLGYFALVIIQRPRLEPGEAARF
ncbi:apolipoprotein N-acyltransferase [Oleiharenicola lentus]|uniref:apolipoprotein N-acyltransferase n=1 Tax=Oleiharenicola lentus TaxID=2508720 RepID=UPI003F67D712